VGVKGRKWRIDRYRGRVKLGKNEEVTGKASEEGECS